jgi:energy-coupling factor transport system ATP-binding protein
MVATKQLIFEYNKRDNEGNVTGKNRAIDEVNLNVTPGSFVAIVGANGSGKSTLAKHLNALLLPTGGTVWIGGIDTRKRNKLLKIRQSTGMVFQNPDNQIIGTVVEEDVGFGPENIGVPTDEIWKRVEESLKAVNMWEYRLNSPNRLSGGQKQRVAIAGVVAMEPSCIVLDESTAMLDPIGCKEVLNCVEELRREKNVTVIWITHNMEEVIHADLVFVMEKGKIVMEGTPKEIFGQVEQIKSHHLDIPQVTMVAHELSKRGIELPPGIVDSKELVEALCTFAKEQKRMDEQDSKEAKIKNSSQQLILGREEMAVSSRSIETTNAIILEKISYTYHTKTPDERHALKEVSMEIPEGQILGIIGHTGSGKSTLIQQMNGLLKATSGSLYYDGENIYEKGVDLKKLRTQVGMVFQYPEHQLFEEDVLKDVAYGPKNQGLSDSEAKERAIKALELVGFPKGHYEHSPFELSGGQKRRAAIAGVLAMEPKVLVLDEPTAGLDPKGRDEILSQIAKLHKETGITVILVSHSMEDIAKYVERIIVLGEGNVIADGLPQEVFSEIEELEKVGLAAPKVTYLMNELKEKGFDINTGIISTEDAVEEIIRYLGNC